MKSVRLIVGSLSPVFILVPFLATADASLQTSAAKSSRLSATARVVIKIVIPPTLFLDVPSADQAAAGRGTASIVSNTRGATVESSRGASADTPARVILSAAGGKVIAQDARCRDGDALHILCTASSP